MKIFKKMKLFPKTFCYMMLLFAIIIAVMHFSIYFFLPGFYMRNIDSESQKKMDDLSDTMQALNWEGWDSVLEAYVKRNGVNITLESDDLKKSFQGDNFLIDVAVSGDHQFQLGNIENVESVIIKNRMVTSRDGRTVRLQMSVNTRTVREAVEVIWLLLPFTSAIAVVFSVVFSYVYSKKITKPIQEMLQVTNSMKNLDQYAYFKVVNEDEIGILAGQINEVYRQLWQSIDNLEKEKNYISEMEKAKVDFLRSASHELKTPLSGLRILLENMQLNVGKYKDHETYLGVSIESVEKISGMVQEILDSSRIQGEIGRSEKSLLCVKDEVEGVLKDYEILAKAKGLDVISEIDEALQIEMNPKFFQRVWSNLISNAVRYTADNGCIRILGNQNEISIWNSCKPLSEEQIRHIFEPFYRPDFARDAYSGGSGLGLYIVREILEANRFDYGFEPREEGMCFYIRSKKD